MYINFLKLVNFPDKLQTSHRQLFIIGVNLNNLKVFFVHGVYSFVKFLFLKVVSFTSGTTGDLRPPEKLISALKLSGFVDVSAVSTVE